VGAAGTHLAPRAARRAAPPHHRATPRRHLPHPARSRRRAADARLGRCTLPVHPPPALPPPQLEALLVKNATLTLRNKPAAFLQFLATFIFILLIYGVSKAIEQQNQRNARYQNVITPKPEPVGAIPDCSASVRAALLRAACAQPRSRARAPLRCAALCAPLTRLRAPPRRAVAPSRHSCS
jgi:hypothetical protein